MLFFFSSFLSSSLHIFQSTKSTGDGALAQLSIAEMNREPGPGMNSVAVIVRHMNGNMLSRWTDFLTTDGEKPWRTRDAEFEATSWTSREAVIAAWDKGWDCVFQALNSLTPDDLANSVMIRGQAHTVVEAIHRQVHHYSYHVGQIVFLARLWRGDEWKTLSIPRGQSKGYTPKGIAGEAKVKG